METSLVSLFFPSVFHSFPSRSSSCDTGVKLAGKDDLEMLSAATLPTAALHKVNYAHRKGRGRFGRAAPGEEGEGRLPATLLFTSKSCVGLVTSK